METDQKTDFWYPEVEKRTSEDEQHDQLHGLQVEDSKGDLDRKSQKMAAIQAAQHILDAGKQTSVLETSHGIFFELNDLHVFGYELISAFILVTHIESPGKYTNHIDALKYQHWPHDGFLKCTHRST